MQPSYRTAVPSAAALEEEVRAARERHQQRLEALARLSADHDAMSREMGLSSPGTPAASQSSLDGPGWWGWLRRLPLLSRLLSPPQDSARLEDQVEAAQRRVLQLAHHLDRLAADRALLLREIEALEQRCSDYAADARLAAEALARLEGEIEQGWARGESQALREAQLVQRATELRAYERAQKRLAAIGHLHREFLRLDERLERGLSELHTAGTALLDELDRQLARLATEDRARQLAQVLGSEMGSLRDSVARVNRLASEGAVLLTEGLDRLACEVDLLAPVEPEAVAAEHELALFLSDRTAQQAVARARQQAALARRLSSLGKLEEPK